MSKSKVDHALNWVGVIVGIICAITVFVALFSIPWTAGLPIPIAITGNVLLGAFVVTYVWMLLRGTK